MPFEAFESHAIEGWLEDLATKGLQLKQINGLFFKFKKINPCRIHYRIEWYPQDNSRTERERRTLILENGWEYVTAFATNYTIYCTQDLDQEELPEDVLPPVHKVFWNELPFLWIAASIGFYLIYLLIVFSTYQLSLRELLGQELFWILTAFLVLAISVSVRGYLQVHSYRKWKRQKETERLSLRKAQNIRTKPWRNIAKLVFSGLAICCFSILIVVSAGLLEAKEIALQEYTKEIPFPLLAEISPEEGQELSALIASEQRQNYRNTMIKQRSPLAPLQIETNEAWDIEWYEEMMVKSLHSYSVNYYQLCSVPLAKKLARELENWQIMRPIKIPDRPTVQAAYGERMSFQILILQYENLVMSVWYQGETDLRSCIPLYEAYLFGKNTSAS